MADEKEPSKKELLEALERANGLIAAQSKAIETLQAQMPAPLVVQPPPNKVPYEGLVRAKEACFIDHLRGPGEVWHHKTDCLWSDDPFEPCIVTSTRDDGTPNSDKHPDAPDPVPFQLRPRSVDAMSARASTPQTASQW